MVPCLVVTLWILGERTAYFVLERVDEEALLGVVAALVREGRVGDALTWSLRAPNTLGRVLAAGLARIEEGDAEALAAMDVVALREQPRIEGRTKFLAPVAQVAALFGFLGTLTGLVHPGYGCVSGHGGGPTIDPTRKAELLAGGIAEALHCTHFGLVVGAVAVAVSYALREPTARSLAQLDAAAALVVVLAHERHAARRLGPAYR